MVKYYKFHWQTKPKKLKICYIHIQVSINLMMMKNTNNRLKYLKERFDFNFLSQNFLKELTFLIC